MSKTWLPAKKVTGSTRHDTSQTPRSGTNKQTKAECAHPSANSSQPTVSAWTCFLSPTSGFVRASFVNPLAGSTRCPNPGVQRKEKVLAFWAPDQTSTDSSTQMIFCFHGIQSFEGGGPHEMSRNPPHVADKCWIDMTRTSGGWSASLSRSGMGHGHA